MIKNDLIKQTIENQTQIWLHIPESPYFKNMEHPLTCSNSEEMFKYLRMDGLNTYANISEIVLNSLRKGLYLFTSMVSVHLFKQDISWIYYESGYCSSQRYFTRLISIAIDREHQEISLNYQNRTQAETTRFRVFRKDTPSNSIEETLKTVIDYSRFKNFLSGIDY